MLFAAFMLYTHRCIQTEFHLTTGTITMALLENLKPGQIYFVKVSASNDMGDGPFSHAVELTVREGLPLGHDIRVSRGSTSQ